MSQSEFRFPSVQELDTYTAQRAFDRGWTFPYADATRIRRPPWLDAEDAEEALERSAYTDPISVMITFLRIED